MSASRSKHAVVTGGAGFVGTNLTSRLVREGLRVIVFDNLSRPGVEQNARWLQQTWGDRVWVEEADVCDERALRSVLAGADQVFHLAAQVAVTTSVTAPLDDFRVNAEGTLKLLEECRRLDEPPFVLFTSTNKVYGSLPGLELVRREDRWVPRDAELREHGLSEEWPLDFATPYGCSKGAADQYVLDYAKSFGVPTTVFRMSCTYGPHQHGNEDQGWVAHFAIRALEGREITVYGDGCQVRDILYVDDLVDAMLVARERADAVIGSAFNLGGGAENAVSLVEALDLLAELGGAAPEFSFAETRTGDQRYYVADSRRFQAATGWRPRVGAVEGIERLHRWLAGERAPAAPLRAVAQ